MAVTTSINQEHGDAGSAPPLALTEKQVARHLGLSVATLRAWRLRGRGPGFVRFGRAVRYLADDVEQFVRASRVETEIEVGQQGLGSRGSTKHKGKKS